MSSQQRTAALSDKQASISSRAIPAAGGIQSHFQGPHVIPNPFDNTLLIQGTPQEWEQIRNLLQQLDVAPRQVLIDAKIYEVDLDNEFAAGVSSYLRKAGKLGDGLGAIGSGRRQHRRAHPIAPWSWRRQRAQAVLGPAHHWSPGFAQPRVIGGTAGFRKREGRTKVISAPSIIATDSGVPATMNVGTQVPVLTSRRESGFWRGAIRRQLRIRQHRQQSEHGRHAEPYGDM